MKGDASTPREIPPSVFDLPKGHPVSYLVADLSTTPVAAFIASTGLFNRAVPALFQTLGVKDSKRIVALGALYFLAAYPLGAGLSIYGQSLGPQRVYRNKNPRVVLPYLAGLGQRLVATHHNLMETFPAWAFAAMSVQVLSPDSTYLINLLALHALLKTTLFPFAYALDLDGLRSTAHMVSIGAIVALFWELVRK